MQYFGRSFIYNTLWSIQGFFIQDFPPVRSPGRRERSAACDAAPGFIATVLSRICGNIVLGGPDGPMMNFYEEFGVRNDASVEEIRQAYKTLARVLHPDSQMDEKLRAAAACQMKRLHEILDIFLDPRKRRAYDESLAAAAYPNAALHWAPPEAAEPSVRPLDKFELAQSALRHWSWILMACMILGSGFWYVTARIPTLAESVPNGLPHEALSNGTGPVLRPVEQAAKHEMGNSGAVETRLSSVAEAALPKRTRCRQTRVAWASECSSTDTGCAFRPGSNLGLLGARARSPGAGRCALCSEHPRVFVRRGVVLRASPREARPASLPAGRYRVPAHGKGRNSRWPISRKVQGLRYGRVSRRPISSPRQIARGSVGGSGLDIQRRGQRRNRSGVAPAKLDESDVVDNQARPPAGFKFWRRHVVSPANAVMRAPRELHLFALIVFARASHEPGQ